MGSVDYFEELLWRRNDFNDKEIWAIGKLIELADGRDSFLLGGLEIDLKKIFRLEDDIVGLKGDALAS